LENANLVLCVGSLIGVFVVIELLFFLFSFLFFSLDGKEPKDQGCIKKAKSFFAVRAEK